MQKMTTFLMFEGKAEAAINFYASIFDNSSVISIERYGDSGPGPAGTVKHAIFSLNGQELMCINSFVHHGFTFTPAMSLYVSFDSEREIDTAFGKLSEHGQVLMPLGAYPFSARYGWLNDQFGVSWQLSLSAK